MRRLRPTLEETRAAAEVIGQYLPVTPISREDSLGGSAGAALYVKHEYKSPVGSFKVRGALNLVNEVVQGGVVKRLSTASTGNHGAGMAFACGRLGVPLTVGVPVGADRSKVALVERFGAELEFLGRDLDETKELMLARPQNPTDFFVEDGDSPAIVAGTSTIGREIAKDLPQVEVVVVPVGNGALIGGIGSALKATNPDIQVIGVQSEAAPCMTLSFREGAPRDTESCETFATGMAVRISIPAAVELMLEVVDEMVLVSETELKEAMGLFYGVTGTMVEGAGAAALAAVPKIQNWLLGKTVCLVASGANLDQEIQQEVKERFVSDSASE